MKDSGIEWIGEIPDDWNVRRLKQITRCKDGERIPVDKASRKVGKYPYWGAGSITDYIDSYIFDEELILLGEDGAPFFDRMRNVAHYVNYKCWINNHIHVLQTKKNEVDSQYLTHFLNIVDYRSYINGSIINKLTQSNMGGIDVCYPAYNQQLKIANYINAISTKIDFIKEYAVKNIAKLKEYRQSIITEIVTKGLNNDSKMKDSGVEWIKSIPTHWNVLRGKNVLTILSRPVVADSEVVTCFRDGEVTRRSNRREEGFTFSDKEIGYQGINAGDIVIHGMDGFAGAIGISDSNGKGSPILSVCRPKGENSAEYIVYYLRMLAQQNVFLALATGVRERSCDLRWNKIANLAFILPPSLEQKEIADYLDKKCATIDKLIAEKKRIIDTLEEYKKSLIYECVTGKRECGEVA